MDMSPTPSGATLPGAGRAGFGQASASALSMRWSALHDAASVVAALGGQVAAPMTAELRNFPLQMRDSGGWRRAMAEQGVEDIAAVMEPGLAALLAVRARGGDAVAAATALYVEFIRARDAMLALAPPGGEHGIRRTF
jgi:hypothetical protein